MKIGKHVVLRGFFSSNKDLENSLKEKLALSLMPLEVHFCHVDVLSLYGIPYK